MECQCISVHKTTVQGFGEVQEQAGLACAGGTEQEDVGEGTCWGEEGGQQTPFTVTTEPATVCEVGMAVVVVVVVLGLAVDERLDIEGDERGRRIDGGGCLFISSLYLSSSESYAIEGAAKLLGYSRGRLRAVSTTGRWSVY